MINNKQDELPTDQSVLKKGLTMDQEKQLFNSEMDQLIAINYYELIGSYFNDQVRNKKKFDKVLNIALRCKKLHLDQMFLTAWDQFWTIENETYQDLQIDKIFYHR